MFTSSLSLALIGAATLTVSSRAHAQFSETFVHDGPGSANVVTTGYFNGDALLDFVAVGVDGQLRAYLTGSDGAHVAGPLSAAPLGVNALAAGDLDGDGFDDIVMCVADANDCTFAFGDGTGLFVDPGHLAYDDEPPLNVAVADLDGDGFDDIATGHEFSCRVYSWRSDGARGVEARGYTSLNGSPQRNARTRNLVLADFNGDGLLDVMGGPLTSGLPVFSVRFGVGDGTFGGGRTSQGETNPFVVDDFDGDGALDIIAIMRSGNALGVMHGNGTGTFGAQVAFTVGPVSALAAGDFTGDGVPDLVLQSGNTLTVLANDGTASFSVAWVDSIGSDPMSDVFAPDWDDDGYADVLASTTGDFVDSAYTRAPEPTTTTVALTPPTAAQGAARQLSVSVTSAVGPASGTVTVTVDDAAVGSVTLVDGEGTLALDGGAVGSHTLVATYQGQDLGSVGTTSFVTTARAATVSVTVTPGTAEVFTPRDLSIVVSGPGPEIPSGSVRVDIAGEASLTLPLVAGAARIDAHASDALGEIQVTATYLGDSRFAPATGASSWIATPVPTALALSVTPVSAVVGEGRAVSASVSTTSHGARTGPVTVSVDGAVVGTISAPGTLTIAGGTVGTHTISATFAAAGGYSGASATATFETLRAPTTIVASSGVIGLHLRPSAVLSTSGTPLAGRSVRFTTGGQLICVATTAASGRAECPASVGTLLALVLSGGSDASFVGDATYAPSSDHATLFE